MGAPIRHQALWAVLGDRMSLSTDVRDAFSKPHGMRNFSEHHPMLITLAVVAGFLTAFITLSRYLFEVL